MASNELEVNKGRQADRRSKRQCIEDTNDALAHALLETVRQALGGGANGTDCVSTHFQQMGPPCQGTLLKGAAGEDEAGHLYDSLDQELQERDQELVAYVRVEGQRHEPTAQRQRKGSVHLAHWQPQQRLAERDASVEQPELPGSVHLAMRQCQFESMTPEMVASAYGANALSGKPSPEQRRPRSGQPQPQQAETPSHGSANTTLNGGVYDIVNEGDDCPEAAATDETAERLVSHKKQSSPKAGVPGGPCAHCGTAESPQWRRPLTKKVVLCNACGIYFSRHHSLPRRKKMAGGGLQALSRHAKVVQVPNLTEPPQSSIICDEMLEVEDHAMPASMALPASAQEAQMAAMPARNSGIIRQGLAPAGAHTVQTTGLPSKASEPTLELSLPLMTAMPLMGGINVIVQTFLNPSMASR